MYKKNRLVCGVGVNDLIDNVYISRKPISLYECWKQMLSRCYCVDTISMHPTYIGCSVCDEWLLLSNFKGFYDINYREGFQLDKDILVEGNKVYSPDTCCFVPQYLNKILNDSEGSRGNYPIGVYAISPENHPTRKTTTYMAQCSDGYGKRLTKTFKTLEEASAWYSATKKRVVAEQVQRALSEGAIDDRIANALLARNFC